MPMVRNTLFITLATLGSRLLGLLRDGLIAYWFGVGGQSDAFFAAFRLPNAMRRLLLEGAFSQALLPQLKYHAKQHTLAAFLYHTLRRQAAWALLWTVLAAWFMPWILALLVPGFAASPNTLVLAIEWARWMLPYGGLACLTGILGSYLLFKERPLLPAMLPMILNFGMILAGFVLAPYLARPMNALPIGLVLAGGVQLCVVMMAVYRIGLARSGIALSCGYASGWSFGPALWLAIMAQAHWLLDTWAASYLQPGSVSWLYYGERLLEFPLGLGSALLSTLFLTRLVDYQGQHDRDFQHWVAGGLKVCVMLGLPAVLGLAWLARPIMTVLFLAGDFSAQDARQAALSLAAYAPGLLGLLISKTLISAAAATRQLARLLPMVLGCLLLHGLLNGLLMALGNHQNLAAAASVSVLLQAVLMLRCAQRYGWYCSAQMSGRWLLKVLLACLAMALLLTGFDPSALLAEPRRLMQLTLLGTWIVAAMLVYALTLALLNKAAPAWRRPGRS
ncbi:MAG: murein biosynthesis integral membrane protein MurJ [Methylococcales bacterium]|nr:murein biosynthesis integral membrane protein MurJ [Methylococcales bacterium]